MFPTTLRRFIAVSCCFLALCFLGCSEDEAPELVQSLGLVSGDEQSSKFGTQLPAPLVVRATLSDGSAAVGLTVQFRVIVGDGTLSRSSVNTDDNGRASVRYTLGPELGENVVRATLASDNTESVDFSATAMEFFCEEENPEPISPRPYNPAGSLFLFTSKSRLFEEGGITVSGVIQLETNFPNSSFVATPFIGFPPMGTLLNVPRDCAFSAHGEFFVAQKTFYNEILKVSGSRVATHFATLESFLGIAEITRSPLGVLVGCDEMGPFAVGCRDTLQRYEDALFSGSPGDDCNDDAVAVDQNTEDIYFIYKPDRTLRRVLIDSLAQAGPTEIVTTLATDEAFGAKGMVVDNSGDVHILVDTDDTRAIITVSGGVKSVTFDFFSRGAGDAAGRQSDLALLRGSRVLFTIDTIHNTLVGYNINGAEFFELSPDVGLGTDPEAISTDTATEERVGLAILP